MIEEAYVSFEVAKLLKEKGFNVPLWFYYDQNKEIILASWSGWEEDWNNCLINNEPSPFISAPTHQMAMKWLREEYKIAINIRIDCKKTISYVFDIWDFEIIHPNEFVGGTIDLREQQFDFKSYEEAVEAALKYCLENLI